MLIGYATLSHRHANLAESLAQHAEQIAGAAAQIESLDAKLAQAADETRIRSAAMNWLGMRLPVEEQVYYLPAAPIREAPVELASGKPGDDQGLIGLLLSTLGL